MRAHVRTLARRALAAQGLVGALLVGIGLAVLYGWAWALVFVGGCMLLAAALGERP